MKNRTIFILILLTALLGFLWQSYLQPFLASLTEPAIDLQPKEARLRVPDFSLLDLDDTATRLSRYRGSVVLIGFWATW